MKKSITIETGTIIRKGIVALIVVGVLALINYLALPAWNFRESGIWLMLIAFFGGYALINSWLNSFLCEEEGAFTEALTGILAALIFIVWLIVSASGSVFFNARRYAAIAEQYRNEVTIDEVTETPLDELITIDRDGAILLGNRKMGTMTELVSQYVVDDTYTQISYNGQAYRVSPLAHAGFFKWAKNGSIPGYIRVNVTTGEAEFVEAEINYSNSSYFGENLDRIIRNTYPSLMFERKTPAFEIDDEGNPYWVYTVIKKTISLMGGKDSDGIILVNAKNGKIERYGAEEIPQWVDHAVNGELVIDQLNWNGSYKNGFWNTLAAQKGCTATTEGYGYILGDEDIYLYTGITSLVSDESNIGFALVNMRTRAISYIEYPSAEEYSAMETAKGKVQEKGYEASFPVLMKYNDSFMYFLTLKDNAGLVKAYSFVDAGDYTKVTVAETMQAAWQQMITSKVGTVENITEWSKGTIEEIATVVINGNSIYYIMFEGSDTVYTANVAVSTKLPFMEKGDEIEYAVNAETIISIK